MRSLARKSSDVRRASAASLAPRRAAHFAPASNVAHDFSRIPVHPQLRMSAPDDAVEHHASASAAQLAPVTAPHSVHDVVRAGGQPLDHQTRKQMERRFGRDLGHVRVHADTKANQSAQDLDALAYTVAPHIVFAHPEGASRRGLLAHELTHVLQPGAGGAILRRPRRQKSRAEKLDAWVRELAKRPQDAHAAWKRLQTMQRLAVATEMAKRYGETFAQRFLWYTQHPAEIVNRAYGPGFPELTPDYFHSRGYALWQRDSLNEFWVHPSGKEVQKILDHDPSAPQTLPEEPVVDVNGVKELEDAARAILKDLLDEGTEIERLQAEKVRLQNSQKWTPEYREQFEQYLHDYRALSKTLEDGITDIEELRTSLEAVGSPVASEMSEGLTQLQEMQIWADGQTSDSETMWIQPVEMPDFK
jgi:hypothetical protein